VTCYRRGREPETRSLSLILLPPQQTGCASTGIHGGGQLSESSSTTSWLMDWWWDSKSTDWPWRGPTAVFAPRSRRIWWRQSFSRKTNLDQAWLSNGSATSRPAKASYKPPTDVVLQKGYGVRIVYGWCTDGVRIVYRWGTDGVHSHLQATRLGGDCDHKATSKPPQIADRQSPRPHQNHLNPRCGTHTTIMQLRAQATKIWTAAAERSGDTAVRTGDGLGKRRGASLPAAVQKPPLRRRLRGVQVRASGGLYRNNAI
jgi:hypothetical protein